MFGALNDPAVYSSVWLVAAESSVIPWITAAGFLFSAVVTAILGWAHFHTDKQTGDTATFTAVVGGMKILLDEREEQIVALTRRVDEQAKLVASMREDVMVATHHVVDCERDLREALRRIAVLEDRHG